MEHPGLREVFKLPPGEGPLVLLAPMAGYTDAPMRRISHRYGAAVAYTEMVSDLGLLHDSDKTAALLETLPDEGPVVAHLYGSEPSSLAEAASVAERTHRFVGIDLNAGCPVTKVIRNGAGAALVKEPQRIHDILYAIHRAVKLPVTVKTRIGPYPDQIAIFDILAAAESAGASALTLHARFTSQGHTGETHLDVLGELKARAHIPIIGNGGVCSPYEAWRMLHETHVDAVMIARAAIGNPWVFRDTVEMLQHPDQPPEARPRTAGRPRRDLAETRALLEEHLLTERDFLARNHAKYDSPLDDEPDLEEALATIFRCHLFRYLHGMKGSSYVRGHLYELHSLADIRAAIASCFERETAYRAGDPNPRP